MDWVPGAGPGPGPGPNPIHILLVYYWYWYWYIIGIGIGIGIGIVYIYIYIGGMWLQKPILANLGGAKKTSENNMSLEFRDVFGDFEFKIYENSDYLWYL